MNKRGSSNLGIGLLLILFGGWFLAVRFIPELGNWFWSVTDWPFYVIGAGICFLIFGLVVGLPGLAVPAFILGGIGGILYYQNYTSDWTSWSYAWTLIPGFVGIGVIVAALFGDGGKTGVRSGITLIFFSMVMFLIFGSFFGIQPLGGLWPILLIALGLWMLIQPIFRKRN